MGQKGNNLFLNDYGIYPVHKYTNLPPAEYLTKLHVH